MSCRLLLLTCLLLALATQTGATPGVPSADPAGCTKCRMVWNDTCAPFDRNNETAYNEELLHSFDPIMANLTGPSDLSNASWTEAFQSAHELIKERYAFTERRAVDWDALYRTCAPAVAEAEKAGDKAGYRRALQRYVYAIPDGHVLILPTEGDFGARHADIGGDFGLGITRLDSGDVIVSFVANGSQAEKAGIRFGDRVAAWNGSAIEDAIAMTPYIWAVKKPSTAEGIRLHQQRLLTRGPIGATATITVANRTGIDPRTIPLTAYDDGYANLKRTSWFLGTGINDYGVERFWSDIQPQIANESVTVRTLPGNVTYIAVYAEEYQVYQPFRAAMQNAIANSTRGIVLDLRFNNGGDDNLAACLAGWFVEEPVFYEYVTKYDPGNGQFATIAEAWSTPKQDRYRGPVAVMVSPDTISSGEGLPMVFNRTGRGSIVSFYGTNGAFGMNGVQAMLPLGQYLLFPDGASRDLNGTIQVDSDAKMKGGISPDIRVPLDEETVSRAMAGEDVQLTYALAWLENQTGPTPAPATPARTAPLDTAAALAVLGVVVALARRK